MNIKKTAIFIMPRSSRAWKGAEALWITAAGWAAAAEIKWGHALVGTSDTVATANEVLTYPPGINQPATGKAGKGWKSKLIPSVLITAVKDWKLKKSQPQKWPIENAVNWNEYDVQFIWEQHDLFAGPGKKMATKLNVPLVIYVHAPVVWEAAKWGVKRPLWGPLLEKNVEAKNLKQADLVACVSEDVRQQVIKMGVDPNKTLIAPMSVDGSLFNPAISGNPIREKYSVQHNLIIGWTGSFRSFHGLDTVVKAFQIVLSQFPQARLMLVGDGFEKDHIEKLVQDSGIQQQVIFAGKQSILDIPAYVAAFDIALVSAKSADSFHYFPLKLREYLAMGKATIAPAAGDIPHVFADGKELLLYKPGDTKSLAETITAALGSKEKRDQLGAAAKQHVADNGLWLHELNKVIEKLKINTGN